MRFLKKYPKASANFCKTGYPQLDHLLDVPTIINPAISELTELEVGSYACMDVQYLAVGSAADNG